MFFKKLVEWGHGRHTLFAAFFAVSGTVLEWFHKLGMPYVALIGAVQTLVLAHSAKEDYFQSKGEDKREEDKK